MSLPAQRACPCASGTAYDACCGPLHGGAPAATAETLMRSRYSAFVLGHENHLFCSWHPRTRPDDLTLTPGIVWTGLEVLATTGGGAADDTGTVEFVARSEVGGRAHALHETSRFERRAGRWVYVDGDLHTDLPGEGAPASRLRRPPGRTPRSRSGA